MFCIFMQTLLTHSLPTYTSLFSFISTATEEKEKEKHFSEMLTKHEINVGRAFSSSFLLLENFVCIFHSFFQFFLFFIFLLFTYLPSFGFACLFVEIFCWLCVFLPFEHQREFFLLNHKEITAKLRSDFLLHLILN